MVVEAAEALGDDLLDVLGAVRLLALVAAHGAPAGRYSQPSWIRMLEGNSSSRTTWASS